MSIVAPHTLKLQHFNIHVRYARTRTPHTHTHTHTSRFNSIHQEAPEFVEMSVDQEILVTGIKVVDLLAPYVRGGKIGTALCYCICCLFVCVFVCLWCAVMISCD